MTRQMAGAYMAPMLDLLDSLARTTEAQGKLLLDVIEARAIAQREAGELIAACEQSQALPAWMLERLQRVNGGQHGA